MTKYIFESLTINRIKLFSSKIEKTESCWIWKGQLDKKLPYGVYAGMKAHRISWMIENQSDWPIGKIARHTCHNHSCVNPKHIIPGSYKENWEDSRDKYVKAFKKIDPLHRQLAANKRKKPVKTPYGIFSSVKEAKKNIKMSVNTFHELLRTPGSGFEYLNRAK